MPARKATQGLAGHRMEKAIIKALLDGQSPREVAKWIKPPVSHITVWRYRETVLRPTMANAAALKASLPPGIAPEAPPPADKEPSRAQGVTHPDSGVTQINVESNAFTDTGNSGKRGKHDDMKSVSEAPEEVKQMAQNALLGTQILAIRENRVAAQQDRHRRMMQVVNERAADMELCESCRLTPAEHPWEETYESLDKDGNTKTGKRGCKRFHSVPGGKSGLILRKLKPTGFEYAVDTALLAEFREHEKAIATELGQWQEPSAATVSIQILCPAAAGELPRISFASDDEIAGFAEIGLLQRPT